MAFCCDGYFNCRTALAAARLSAATAASTRLMLIMRSRCASAGCCAMDGTALAAALDSGPVDGLPRKFGIPPGRPPTDSTGLVQPLRGGSLGSWIGLMCGSTADFVLGTGIGFCMDGMMVPC